MHLSQETDCFGSAVSFLWLVLWSHFVSLMFLFQLFADCEYSSLVQFEQHTTLPLSDHWSTFASNVSSPPLFLSWALLSGQRFLFFTCFVTGQRLDGVLAGPRAQKIIQRTNQNRGSDPSAAIRETWARPRPPRCLSQPLWRFRRSTNWASSSSPQQPFCKWRVRERRESGNRHENDVHQVYGRDGEKEIQIKYLGWLDKEGWGWRGFLILPLSHLPLPVSSPSPNL